VQTVVLRQEKRVTARHWASRRDHYLELLRPWQDLDRETGEGLVARASGAGAPGPARDPQPPARGAARGAAPGAPAVAWLSEALRAERRALEEAP